MNGLSGGKYRIKEIRINNKHGSVLEQWNQMSGITDLSPSEIEHLKYMSVPQMQIHILDISDRIQLDIELCANEVYHVSMKQQR